MAEADLELEIPADDLPLAEAGEPESSAAPVAQAAEPHRAEVAPEDAIATLKADLEREKAEKAAERTARQAAEAKAAQAQTEVQDTNVQLVENAISTLKTATDDLDDKYAEAMATGDFAGASKIQREIARNEARLNTLESGLEQLKTAPKPRADTGGPVEKLATQLPPKSAAWVRAHPECATDPRMYKRMIAAHDLAVTDGLEMESPEYFAAVERTLGFGGAEPAPSESVLSSAASPAQRRQSPPAAPVSRNASGGGSTPTRITLTAAQREAAELSGMSYEDYAKQLVRIQRESQGAMH